MPSELSLPEIRMTPILMEVRARQILFDRTAPQKATSPLSGNRIFVEFSVEPPEFAAVGKEEPHVPFQMDLLKQIVPDLPVAEETTVDSPIIAARREDALNLSAAAALPPAGSMPIDAGLRRAPIEAKAAPEPGYRPSSQKIEAPLASRPGPENFAAGLQPTAVESDFDPRMRVSKLQIQGRPDGARVFVNGLLIGETPLAWELPLGKHEVRLALPEYYEWYAQVEITPEHEAFPIMYRLVPLKENPQ